MCIVQDEVNQEESEQNEVDGMKEGVDSTGQVMQPLPTQFSYSRAHPAMLKLRRWKDTYTPQ